MFKFVVLFACVAYTLAAGASNDDVHAEVKDFKADVRADGFDYLLDTTNTIHQQASGDDHGNIHGSYEYVSPEGEHIKVSYVADEHGYQPDSALLPTPPPIPDAILKGLEYIKAHPPKDESKH
ncbi:larval cuticle protein 2-like [Haematobia irritans]|uniref:larval cuticle protein 2-like n=1 Tax=Haematobia irritans TaxID=7368 RepID=UPI003F5064D1